MTRTSTSTAPTSNAHNLPEYGELVICGAVLKRDVVDLVVQQVLDIIKVQLAKVPTQIVQALILVGGFAAFKYLLQSYIMKCKLPATEEERYQRPAVLRKGQCLCSRYWKFILSPQDSIFTAFLDVSNSDRIYWYTDKDKRLSLKLACCSVDLSPLPAFQYNAQALTGSLFWCKSDLALQMDSAKISGLLLTDKGEEVGCAIFEFLGTK
ncbi:uncharacterized protein JCM10292_006522 [Rhodotorula paludigena]|uniref:uncharacterized protein n=1 Tax=Rhodotorula paludigena TaxID=86838 RepID=UPI0031774A61